MATLYMLVLSVLASVVAAELCGWASRLATRLIVRAATRLPPPMRDRAREEWQADLLTWPTSLGQLWFATSIYCAGALRRGSAYAPPRTNGKAHPADDLTRADLAWITFDLSRLACHLVGIVAILSMIAGDVVPALQRLQITHHHELLLLSWLSVIDIGFAIVGRVKSGSWSGPAFDRATARQPQTR